MAGDMKQVARRAQDALGRLSPVQKIAIGAGVLTIVVGALVMGRSGGQSDLAPLFTDLDPADASAIVDELSSRSVDYELTDAGRTVLVPQDQLYDLRIALSASGLPASNEGYALLDEQGITTSEFRQRIDYQRALEGELDKTLRAMDGIASATVHLALPEDSVFVDEPAKPSASVLLVPRGADGIGPDQVEAVVHLVASSVKDLEPEDVTVVGSNGEVLSAPGATLGGVGGAASTARSRVEHTFEQQVAGSLTSMLARVTGPGRVAVTVSADLDLSQRQSTTEDFEGGGPDATTPVVSERTSNESYVTDGSAGATGVLGPDGAAVVPTVSTATNGGDYVKSDADRTFALDRTVEQVTEAPGRIEKLHVAVLIDDAAVSADQLGDIESMVSAAAGIDPARGDSLVVTRLPFDTSAVQEAETAAAAEAAAARKADQMALYRTLGIVGLALIALVLAFLSARRARRVLVTPIALGEISATPTAAMPLPATPAAVRAGAPAELVAVGAPEPAHDPSAAALDELADIAERRPEEVASVLKTWLAESNDRRDRR